MSLVVRVALLAVVFVLSPSVYDLRKGAMYPTAQAVNCGEWLGYSATLSQAEIEAIWARQGLHWETRAPGEPGITAWQECDVPWRFWGEDCGAIACMRVRKCTMCRATDVPVQTLIADRGCVRYRCVAKGFRRW